MTKDDTTYKATISIKAETMRELVAALQSIGEAANMSVVLGAAVSTSIAIETDDMDDLRLALESITDALADTAVEATAKAPLAAYRNRRLDPTPMERMINRATGELG